MDRGCSRGQPSHGSEALARWFHQTKHRPYRQVLSALLRTFIEPNGVLAIIRKGRVPFQVVDGRFETVRRRRSEDEVVADLAGLKTTDVDLYHLGVAMVHGKGRRDRSLPLGPTTIEAAVLWPASSMTSVTAPPPFISKTLCYGLPNPAGCASHQRYSSLQAFHFVPLGFGDQLPSASLRLQTLGSTIAQGTRAINGESALFHRPGRASFDHDRGRLALPRNR